CWQEPSTGGRLLRGSSTAADDMTLDKCATFCSAWPYFGTEYGRECYCGLFVSSGGAAAPLADCSFPCAGDATQNCGAGNRVSLYYHKTKPRPESPSTLGDSTRFGCLTDSRDGRTLSVAGPASDDMTLESCATFCAGYKFWGVEYGRECYCGNEMLQTAVQVENSECDMLCLGNSAELCGAGDRVMVYARD
ncbi:putative fungistatic metabolite, partial [Podospora australis]